MCYLSFTPRQARCSRDFPAITRVSSDSLSRRSPCCRSRPVLEATWLAVRLHPGAPKPSELLLALSPLFSQKCATPRVLQQPSKVARRVERDLSEPTTNPPGSVLGKVALLARVDDRLRDRTGRNSMAGRIEEGRGQSVGVSAEGYVANDGLFPESKKILCETSKNGVVACRPCVVRELRRSTEMR